MGSREGSDTCLRTFGRIGGVVVGFRFSLRSGFALSSLRRAWRHVMSSLCEYFFCARAGHTNSTDAFVGFLILPHDACAGLEAELAIDQLYHARSQLWDAGEEFVQLFLRAKRAVDCGGSDAG
jgi:hypothetical protein